MKTENGVTTVNVKTVWMESVVCEICEICERPDVCYNPKTDFVPHYCGACGRELSEDVTGPIVPAGDGFARVSDSVNSICKSRGWTSAQLAQEVGVSAAAVNDWKQGRRKPGGPAIKILSSLA